MKEFQANRLAGGNRLFPAKVTIDDFGVTLKIPGLFSGQEKSLGFHQISSVKIDSPMLGFSKVTFDTIGWDRIVAEGFEKDDANEIKALVQRGISSVRAGGTSFGSNPEPVLQNYIDPATIAAAHAATAAAQAEQARIALEKQKHDDESALRRRQQEAEEVKNRRIRADQLRSQGKNIQALFIEFGTWIGVAAFGLLVIGFFAFKYINSSSTASQGAAINQQLEVIDSQIRLAIEAGDRTIALELVEQLVHPLHEEWEDKTKWDTWNGFPRYDEWWAKKRESYRERILALPREMSTPLGTTSESDPAGAQHSVALDSMASDTPPQELVANSASLTTQETRLFKIDDADGYSNLRESPEGPIIRKVFAGEQFNVILSEGQYKRVRLDDGTEGYIHASRVVAVE